MKYKYWKFFLPKLNIFKYTNIQKYTEYAK